MKLALLFVFTLTQALAGTIAYSNQNGTETIPSGPGQTCCIASSGSINLILNPNVNQSGYIAPGTAHALLSSWDISALVESYNARSFTVTVSTTGNVYLGMIDLFSGSTYLGSNALFPSGSTFSMYLNIPVGIVSSLQLYTDVPERFLGDNQITSGTIQTTVSVNGLQGLGNASGNSYGNTNSIVGGVRQVGAVPEPKTLLLLLLGVLALLLLPLFRKR